MRPWAPAVGLALAACAMPPAPDEARLRTGDATIDGTVGIGFTNEEIRRDLVAPECAARGLSVGSIAIGRIEDGARRVTATCAP